MSETTTTGRERLVSLDAFRGITIAGMILVNNPGSWGHVYAPLGHAAWDGWTPTDLVFPFFLFIVGVAMALSSRRRLEQGASGAALMGQVARRTVVLFLLGLIMCGFPDFRLIGPYVLVIVGLGLAFARVRRWGVAVPHQQVAGWMVLLGGVVYFALDFAYFQESSLRVPGVLQRIAVCYFVASTITLFCGAWGEAFWAVLLIVGYWLIVRLVAAPVSYAAEVGGSSGLLHDWIDVQLLGEHLYRYRPDPEGILSTLPAVATVLLGALTGRWLQGGGDRREKVIGLFLAANVALVLGLVMSYDFAINKKIWSSSYVVFTAGLALHFLAMCYWLLDVKGYRRWSWPFVVLGTNAIAVYVASSLGAKLLYRTRIDTADGGAVSLKGWIYEYMFASWAGALNGSLLFALAYVALWFVVLIPLHRRGVFIRV